MSKCSHYPSAAGFTLLPVVLTMGLVGSIAFMLNLDNAVSANWIGAQSDRVRARYAAEAGLQAANYTIQGLGCGGGYPISSSPVTDSNFGGASYSAYANNTTGSPLTLTSTGTYNGASVTLTRANVYVYQSGVRNWATQPGPATGKETYVRSDPANRNKNYGGDTELILDRDGHEILIQFDLTPLPAGSRPVSWYSGLYGLQPGGIVSLYLKKNPNKSFTASLITRSWVAGTLNGGGAAPNGATWNTYDGVNAWPSPGVGYDPRPLRQVPEGNSGWLDFGMGDAVWAWMSGVYPNYGLWLHDINDDAKDYAAHSNNSLLFLLRPMLTVYYLLPCGATAP